MKLIRSYKFILVSLGALLFLVCSGVNVNADYDRYGTYSDNNNSNNKDGNDGGDGGGIPISGGGTVVPPSDSGSSLNGATTLGSGSASTGNNVQATNNIVASNNSTINRNINGNIDNSLKNSNVSKNNGDVITAMPGNETSKAGSKLQSNSKTISSKDAISMAKQKGLKVQKLSSKAAKKVTALSINDKSQLNDVLSGKYDGKISGKAKVQVLDHTRNTGTKKISKNIYFNGVLSVKGNVKLKTKGNKIQKVKSVWSESTGMSWPIEWQQNKAWAKINKNRKSGEAYFRGNRIYYLTVAGTDLKYTRPTTLRMSFKI
ncbi:hypothetical protein [Lentilactobacillus kosonis]|uniref:Surface layer protein A domain-containing protein n=1 Tax=Lentilactobacillus kosonis TaxID=2810561 RepID=A0A401FHY7_9LACO|nr:hypothetical protein [Lentilactobacillus kosonis]GAY71962.1 hypothetical protein NBRC111893_108 [Lentilactobacillus kosonis]